MAAVLLAAFSGFVLGNVAGGDTAPAIASPTDTSADAGFARAMQVHHNQGVEIAMIIRDATDDVEVRVMAYDMAVTQAQQSGQMYAWLELWGLTQSSTVDPMAWMDGHGSHGAGVAMPGLATSAQLAELRAASGVEAEVLFLELMIVHHEGAVDMADAALERATTPEVKRLAQSILDYQSKEIRIMQDMLAARS
ncbi:MAG: DUF305 domain-containing protein [Actinobacteria bacterium HGW-Actinobacteria-4]|nr:MAG: DUF305 domain-containing protein [Actinobacteria bacterium HGW-Actinobacteria-4]